MSLVGCQIIPIDLNFYLQKCLEIFDIKSADESNPKIIREVSQPCLMPIRVTSHKLDQEFVISLVCNSLLEMSKFELIAGYLMCTARLNSYESSFIKNYIFKISAILHKNQTH